MQKKFFDNIRNPQGTLGKVALNNMNKDHEELATWGFSHLNLQDNFHILDVGCGGGANIAKMLEEFPESLVDGLDYSEESVLFSKRLNALQLGKRCCIQQGDVSRLPYAKQSLNVVTAFQTIYFWPDLEVAFKEINRVLKPGGTFFICCEFENDIVLPDNIEGITIYKGEDLESTLLNAGFCNIKINRNEKGWMCLLATC